MKQFRRIPKALLLALVIIVAISVPVAATEEPAVVLSTDVETVRFGEIFTVAAAFEEVVESNAITMYYSYDYEVFEYVEYVEDPSTSVVDIWQDAGTVQVTLVAQDYNAKNLGNLVLRVSEYAGLMQEEQAVSLIVEYVAVPEDGEDGEKGIATVKDSVSLTILERVAGPRIEGDTNADYTVDLVDLSNIYDWFGLAGEDNDWGWHSHFDFNKNDQIDIYDVSYVARLIRANDKETLEILIAQAEGLDETDYTEESWAHLQETLAEAKAVSEEALIPRAVLALKRAIAQLEEIAKATVGFVPTPYTAQIEVVDENDVVMEPVAGRRFVYRLKPGGYTYSVSHKDYDTVNESFSVAEDNITITVELAGVIEAVVSFVPTPYDAQIKVADENEVTMEPVVDESFAYRLKPGNYTYTVSHEDYATVNESFSVVEDIIITVELERVDGSSSETEQSSESNSLQTPLETSTLQALVARANELRAESYTHDNWAQVSAALEKANQVLSNSGATQLEVDDSANNLQLALEHLVGAVLPGPADRTALAALKAEAEALDQSQYTAESWTALKDVLARAELVIQNSSAAQEEIDTIVADLRNAMSALAYM